MGVVCLGHGMGNTYVDRNGYLRDEETDFLVHREIYEKAYGVVANRWVVHHVNGDKKDNRPENLVSLHWRIHDAIHQTWPKGTLPSKNEILLWLRIIARFSPKVARGLLAQGKPRKTARRPLKPKRAAIFKPTVLIRKKGATS